MSVRLMHLADLHLGSPFSYLGDKANQRAKDIENALWRALESAPAKHVHAIMIAGDLFDSFSPPPELVGRVKSAFEKAAENGIAVILIPGTHDSHRYGRCVYHKEVFPGVDILFGAAKPVQKELNGERVYFYGFSSGERGEKPAFCRGDEKGTHVALAHGTVTEGTHWSASARDFSLRENDIGSSGFHYVALGHHHNFREFKCGGVPAIYPGTLEGLKFGEDGDRYLVIAEISENGASIEKIKHNQRTISEIRVDLTLAGIESTEELITALEKHADPDGIARVCITGTAGFLLEPQTIEARLANRFFHLEVTDETSVCGSDMIRALKGENTIRGLFVRKMLDKIEQSSAEERAPLEHALRLGIEQFMRTKNENQQILD